MELLDDYQHQDRSIPRDEELIRFEGLVPYILLDGTAVADICALLDKANLVYGVENPSIQGNANSGITSAVHNLGVLLHVREEDKTQIDALVAAYEEQAQEGEQQPSNSALQVVTVAILSFIAFIIVVIGVIYLFF